jgi:hypothetical protein
MVAGGGGVNMKFIRGRCAGKAAEVRRSVGVIGAM